MIVLDGKNVAHIDSFLRPRKHGPDPFRLAANSGKSFQGSIVLGMGFTFDDNNEKATPIAEMERLIREDPRNAERIFPYMGGKELNSSPTHSYRRYVIDFGQMSEAEARRWPDLTAIVEAKVKPKRQLLRDNPDGRRCKRYWWQYSDARPGLYRSIAGLDRVLCNSQVSAQHAFAFQPTNRVFAGSLNVFPLSSYAAIAILQSRPHELWARFLASSLGDGLRYTPTDCFETFPFPPNWEQNATLESLGKAYYEFRAALMVKNDQGLTATYNRFHDPDERDAQIQKLRDLHAAMDRAVLDAYGWQDIQPRFTVDHRWDEDTIDEVYSRLLTLNFERAQAET